MKFQLTQDYAQVVLVVEVVVESEYTLPAVVVVHTLTFQPQDLEHSYSHEHVVVVFEPFQEIKYHHSFDEMDVEMDMVIGLHFPNRVVLVNHQSLSHFLCLLNYNSYFY